MAEKKYKITEDQAVNLCMQIWQSGAGKMEFESIKDAFKYFSMIVENQAYHGGWEEVEE